IIGTLDELGVSFHDDWKGAWPAADEGIMQLQQESILKALHEITTAIEMIIDISHHKQREYEVMTKQRGEKGAVIVAGQYPLSLPSTSTQILPSLNDFHELMSEEIKTEPMDMKEEPFDEPIIDAFCPMWTSRSIGSEDNGNFNAEILKEEVMEYSIPCSSTVKEEQQSMGDLAARGREEEPARMMSRDTSASVPNPQSLSLAAWRIQPIDSMKSGWPQWKKCFICSNLTFKYYALPKHHRGERLAFFDRIIAVNLTEEEKNMINVLKHGNEDAYFCLKHIFAPYKPPAKRRKNMANTTERLIQNQPIRHSSVARSNTTFHEKERRCELCGAPASPFTLSPKEPANALRFIQQLRNITAHQRQKLHYFAKLGRVWTVCRRHIPEDLRVSSHSTRNLSVFNPSSRTVPEGRSISCALQRISSECDDLLKAAVRHTKDLKKKDEIEVKEEELDEFA
ncbi:hypothetical protein PMAYCL1PPCAC_30386, partial [Pristionchus mayeri]